MNPAHHCKCVLRTICLVGNIFVCMICNGLIESSWENRPYTPGTYQTQQTPPGKPEEGNDRAPTGEERTVIDVAGVTDTRTVTGHSGSVTFDPAKFIHKDWSGRS